MDLSTLPITYQATIPESYRDEMGHMNVMWYMHLFTEASWPFFGLFGMDRTYCETNQKGAFVLEQHIRYLHEVHIGNAIVIRTRVLGRSAKRIHYISFMTVDDDSSPTGTLSATLETIETNVDMHTRRSAPFAPDIAANIDKLIAQHRQISWQPPICRVITP